MSSSITSHNATNKIHFGLLQSPSLYHRSRCLLWDHFALHLFFFHFFVRTLMLHVSIVVQSSILFFLSSFPFHLSYHILEFPYYEIHISIISTIIITIHQQLESQILFLLLRLFFLFFVMCDEWHKLFFHGDSLFRWFFAKILFSLWPPA